MDPNDSEYTVVINGKPEGPYRLDQLKILHIETGTFIRKPGMDDYKEAHEFPELRALLGFTYQQTAPQYFAAFDQRLLACVIDYFFIFTAYVLLILVSFIFVEEKTQRIMLSNTDVQAKQAKTMEMLQHLHIEHLKDKKITQLSGGEQQRVAIAKAML